MRTTVFHEGPFKTIADVEHATAGWVDWYNNERLHGSLNMASPNEFESAYYATLTECRNPNNNGTEPRTVQTCYPFEVRMQTRSTVAGQRS